MRVRTGRNRGRIRGGDDAWSLFWEVIYPGRKSPNGVLLPTLFLSGLFYLFRVIFHHNAQGRRVLFFLLFLCLARIFGVTGSIFSPGFSSFSSFSIV